MTINFNIQYEIKNIDFYEVNNFAYYWQICKYGPKTIRLQKKD